MNHLGQCANGKEGSVLCNPVFVVGVPRSGTSLLYSLLNRHPRVALMYECDVWHFPKTFSNLRFQRDWLERQEFHNQALSRHRLIYGSAIRGLENVHTPEELYRTFCPDKSTGLWGEKSPFYCFRLRQLARRYPGASFVLIWRDPLEIYRSVVNAGRRERFFRRRGMLSRLIQYQEQMVQQALELERAGMHVHHVTYASLVDKTRETCEGVCRFLGIEYNERMLDLSHADFSAIYDAPQHDYLRRGVIKRQELAAGLVSPSIMRKLERFRARWSRLNCAWFPPDVSRKHPEPSVLERFYHGITGSLFCRWDDLKRILFEFLPLPWLQTYRETARWLFARDAAAAQKRLSLKEQWVTHWGTILVGFALTAGVASLQMFANPRMVFLPLYVIPCAFLTLVVNRRWGTLVSAVAAVVGPVIQSTMDADFAHYGVVLWNCAMRFVILQIVVLLLDRIRLEMSFTDTNATPDDRQHANGTPELQ